MEKSEIVFYQLWFFGVISSILLNTTMGFMWESLVGLVAGSLTMFNFFVGVISRIQLNRVKEATEYKYVIRHGLDPVKVYNEEIQ